MSPLVRRVLAPNPGPMTLDGTNSYVIASPTAESVIVVDPGPDDDAHLAALAALGSVGLILLTHHHADHADGIDTLVALTGAPVRAVDPALCRDAPPLADDELIESAGVRLRVLATPGHTADSACFHLLGDTGSDTHGAVFTGDTVLGRGTSIIADPDGALGPYLRSLERLQELGPVGVLPGHGPELESLSAVAAAYLAHRAGRLAEVRRALEQLGADATARAVADLVYADTDAAVRPAAEASVRAQLQYLRSGTD
ncbi:MULTISPECIES: MBL fold metallo-hydrolase [unclassified Leifsonia]|uniref:MBL fold metallo-hydrolase n=1 Tax=unclassified Leifsonia TaxID=2663824 RepID=UPI00070138E9|nr:MULTISPECIES: MBL fold metallo-hydrolase [unclassified Leifsonia]KQX05881.1 Zn-dependent hydrolase [Leifsonia sp. Root1293]KRA09514.1 Zn-dependent hydrolase [Leifsonia sp. Root60]